MIRSINGKTPKIADSAFVSEAAYVVGDVEIGENTSIWPGAVIRADFGRIRIGNNTLIEDNCVLHSADSLEIGDNVVVGHSVVVHCRIIKNNTLIGNNSTVLDGAEIGSLCVIAAGSVVTPGTKIPDNSFVVGVPAKIRAGAHSQIQERLEKGPGAYHELARQYKEQGL